MNRTEKKEVVKSFNKTLKASKVAIVTHYRGLTVAEMTELRANARKVDCGVRVVKNTLVRRALKGTDFGPLDAHLEGPTAIVTSADPVAPAKVLSDFAKEHKNLKILGGVLEGQALDVAGIEALAKLPSREVLVAKMLGTMMAPVQNFVGVLAAVPGGFVRVLEQIRQQKEQAAS